jgi:hypothetical protein
VDIFVKPSAHTPKFHTTRIVFSLYLKRNKALTMPYVEPMLGGFVEFLQPVLAG